MGINNSRIQPQSDTLYSVIIVCDNNGMFLEANKEFEEILGY